MDTKMEDNYTHNHLQQQQTGFGFDLRNTGGEIVEVQGGGHIVRSTGRKDRHSKVCTAKGLRDRRVRLSAHTAIQFYDVQDRLGYDRPSKAVDWLIKKAQAAINQLDELPAWKPASVSLSNPNFQRAKEEENLNQLGFDDSSNGNSKQSENSSSFLPPSLDSDSIADTIKSFFPMSASPEGNSSAVQFQSQDLRLSLQSFQQQQTHQHQNPNTHQSQTIYSGTPLGFAGLGSGSGWSENQPAEISRFQKMFSWNSSGDNSGGGGGDGSGGALMFNAPPPAPLLFGQNHLFLQRGPLQSSNTPSVRAWIDPSAVMAAVDHNHHQQQQLHQSLPFYQSQMPGVGFTSGSGFPGFGVQARIQCDQEEHGSISDKPSSNSSESRR